MKNRILQKEEIQQNMKTVTPVLQNEMLLECCNNLKTTDSVLMSLFMRML